MGGGPRFPSVGSIRGTPIALSIRHAEADARSAAFGYDCPADEEEDLMSRRPIWLMQSMVALVWMVAPLRAVEPLLDAGGWKIGNTSYPMSRAGNALEMGVTREPDADQTRALNDALRRIEQDKDRDTLYLPSGRYLVKGQLSLRPGVNLIGDGMTRTVIERRDSSNYLLANRRLAGALVAHLTLDNEVRTVMLQNCSKMRFEEVEFRGGIVRFEHCDGITLANNTFNENAGKAGYAGSNCTNMTLTHNRFNSIGGGSINLSGHKDSYVAFNHITADAQIESGYAGIRLPNGATNNLVENNLIENHGRGLFVLSSSTNNTLRGNVVKSSTYQGVLIQSSNNVLEANVIVDAGDEAIYVVDANSAGCPAPSVASGNRVVGNTIYDTRAPADVNRFVGVRVASSGNVVRADAVSTQFGRVAFEIGVNNDTGENTTYEAVTSGGAVPGQAQQTNRP